jgi:hypothetical protein
MNEPLDAASHIQVSTPTSKPTASIGVFSRIGRTSGAWSWRYVSAPGGRWLGRFAWNRMALPLHENASSRAA